MPENRQLLDVSVSNIRELLKRLSEYEQVFLLGAESEPCRVYFVDTDVMSRYLEGRPGNYTTNWTSLLSLTESSRYREDRDLADGARRLADTLCLAISGFLFGRFLKTLLAQRGRLYITPEHGRELNAIKLAIIGALGKQNLVEKDWLDKLQRLYVNLCQAAHHASLVIDNVQAIIAQLAAHPNFGKLSRLHALEMQRTVPLSTHLMAPPYAAERPFILDTRPPKQAERIRGLASEAFEVFITTLKERHPAITSLAIKRKVFSLHKPSLRMIDYVRGVADDPELSSQHSPEDLKTETTYAALQVADVVSLARIAALAEHLNEVHPLTNRRWEVCLITGSEMLRDLHRNWLAGKGATLSVRVIHPLCFLRHAELFDPEGAEGVEKHLQEKLDDEYALRILGGADSQGSERSIDPGLFCESLRRALASVAARVAEEDRWMSVLRLRLKHDEGFDHTKYVSVVRESIAYFFFRVYAQINELAPDRDRKLPSGNIPMLSLPRADKRGTAASEEFFVNLLQRARREYPEDGRIFKRLTGLRRKQPETIDYGALLKPVMEDDDAGYSTMLCAAVGYIAKGRYWLGAAETMASTAAMLALGGERPAYPQGNEALYLKAFLLRMRFLDSDIEEMDSWLAHHHRVIKQAFEALEVWRMGEASLAAEPVSAKGEQGEFNRFTMLALRYRVEEIAAHAFVWLARVARNSYVSDSGGALSRTHLVNEVMTLLRDWLPWRSVDVAGVHRPGRDFLGTQLWAVVLQSWLCGSVEVESAMSSASPESGEFVQAVRALELAIAQYLSEYMNSVPDSLLVRMLAEIFLIRTEQGSRGHYGVKEAHFHSGEFADFDKPCRFPFFLAKWRAVRRSALTE